MQTHTNAMICIWQLLQISKKHIVFFEKNLIFEVKYDIMVMFDSSIISDNNIQVM